MKGLTGKLAVIVGFLKARKDRSKFWERLYDELVVCVLCVKHGTFDLEGREPKLSNVLPYMAKILVKRHARKYIPGYVPLEKAATKLRKRLRYRWHRIKWAILDSRLNQWLHTKGKQRVHTLGGLIRTVNVYQTDLCYGGPEEGGWWFDAYTLLDSRKCLARNAEVVRETLRAKWSPEIDDEDGRPYTSVLNGRECRVFVEDWKGESETRERPRYS